MIPEKELVVLTCDMNPSKEKMEQVNKLVSAGIDFDLFIKLAYENKTIPLVFTNFRDILPKNNQRVADKITLLFNKIQDEFFNELVFISDIFRKNDIPFIVLKGFPLAQQLYGNYYLRNINDIDILVRKSDFPKADSLLINADYGYRGGKTAKDWLEKNHMHLEYMHSSRKIDVEVHWTLGMEKWNLKIPEESYWKDLDKVMIKDHTFNTLNPEYTFLFSSLHLMMHETHGNDPEGLRYVYETHLMIEKYKIDWIKVFRLAKEYHNASYLYNILLTAKRFFNTSVPDDVMDNLKACNDLGRKVFVTRLLK